MNAIVTITRGKDSETFEGKVLSLTTHGAVVVTNAASPEVGEWFAFSSKNVSCFVSRNNN